MNFRGVFFVYQWGNLSYTWAPKGKQPTVKTAGLPRGYKVFGLIDYWTGKFFYKSIKSKFTAETYTAFLQEVLAQTRKHLIIIQDGARFHTSEDMQAFFYENKEGSRLFRCQRTLPTTTQLRRSEKNQDKGSSPQAPPNF